MTIPQAQHVDILLLLEGTYPYVRGGVSSWVHQLIQEFPDYTFGLIFIGGQPDQYGDIKYPLPKQVVHLEHHYVHGHLKKPPIQARPGNPEIFRHTQQFHDWMKDAQSCPHREEIHAYLLPLLSSTPESIHAEFLYSKAAWQFLTDAYQKYCTDPSFIDFFWTVREMHEPLWVLAKAASQCPRAKIFHTVSTGYAGFLGTLLHYRTSRPLILSEHGIYTKERQIDLYQANWLKDHRLSFEKRDSQLGYFQHMWIRFFQTLGKMCYGVADPILSIYGANRQRQINDGADAKKTAVIPNGIDVERFAPLRACRPETTPPILCLVGRVVPIKDIKTFIRAMRTVVNRIPQAQGWIAGPEEEDPSYVEECQQLASNLGLSSQVKFLGVQKVDELYSQIGLLIVSSISEALPLVILEAFAAGVPVVSTDVGGCRELIYGTGNPPDVEGAAGAIVGMANPTTLAEAALRLLLRQDEWNTAQYVGIKRVEACYTQEQMIGRYRDIYSEAIQYGRNRV